MIICPMEGQGKDSQEVTFELGVNNAQGRRSDSAERLRHGGWGVGNGNSGWPGQTEGLAGSGIGLIGSLST